MSWDLMVCNYNGSPPNNFEDPSNDPKPDSLGSADNVRRSISQNLPGVDWSDPTWGTYDGDEFSIEFNTGDEDPIDSIMLHVRGSGDPITAILQFANPNKWTLKDLTTGEYLDPENPSPEGWKNFQDFRDNALDQYRDEGKA